MPSMRAIRFFSCICVSCSTRISAPAASSKVSRSHSHAGHGWRNMGTSACSIEFTVGTGKRWSQWGVKFYPEPPPQGARPSSLFQMLVRFAIAERRQVDALGVEEGARRVGRVAGVVAQGPADGFLDKEFFFRR